MSTLPAKRRRVAISVTAKKEICQRKLENPKATQGIHHAHLFLAALEQHGEEEYAPIRKIMDRMHTALVSSATQTKISDFFKPALPS